MKYARVVLSAAALVAASGIAMAQEPLPQPQTSTPAEPEVEKPPFFQTKNLKLVIGGGVTFGGTKLITVFNNNGTESSDIRAGQLIDIHAGLEYRWDDWAIQGTVGYHFDPIQDGEVDVSFERFPIELLGYYKLNDRFRVGGGIRYAKDAQLSGDGGWGNALGVTKFDSHPGGVMEVEYRASPHVSWKLRYVIETYETSQTEITGKHWGLFMNTYW